jgi:two-component system, NtrC family, response regulator
MAKILIVDDDASIREVLAENARMLGHDAASVETLSEAFIFSERDSYDLMFLDVRLPDGNGLHALPKIKEMAHDPEVIIITGMGDSQGAELAIKYGAWDYMEKPFNRQEIALQIKQAVAFRNSKTKTGNISLKREAVIGNSKALTRCLDQIAQCAGTDTNVLLSGETGTGKELLARTIHENSKRSTGPFVVLDCTVLPENLIESILFGHVKGAFTGAEKEQDGLIMQADGGTLFLDEVGELHPSAQMRFLRFLQERRFRPVGGIREIECDFRLISATHKSLDDMVREHRFRNDLLFRLRTFSIHVPPLRNRTGDIQPLIQHYLFQLCQTHGKIIKGFVPEFLEILMAYNWPGNVREMINILEQAIVSDPENPTLYPMHLPKELRIRHAQSGLSGNDRRTNLEERKAANKSKRLDLSHLLIDPPPSMKSFRDKITSECEIQYLEHLMALTHNKIKNASEIAGVSVSRLYALLRKYGIAVK